MKGRCGQSANQENRGRGGAKGAQAYPSAQYMTIAVVGIVIFARCWPTFLGMLVAAGFANRRGARLLSGRHGFIGMNVSVRANVRTAQAATTSLAGGLDSPSRPAPSPACWGGLALLGVTIYFTYLTHYMGLAANSRTVVRCAGGARLRRFADFDLCASRRAASSPRAPTSRRDLVGKVEARHSRRRSAQPGHHSPTTSANNVGDCAGMAADLFETYAVTAVATNGARRESSFATSPLLVNMMTLPLAIRRRLHHHLDHRHLLRQARRQPVDHGRRSTKA